MSMLGPNVSIYSRLATQRYTRLVCLFLDVPIHSTERVTGVYIYCQQNIASNNFQDLCSYVSMNLFYSRSNSFNFTDVDLKLRGNNSQSTSAGIGVLTLCQQRIAFWLYRTVIIFISSKHTSALVSRLESSYAHIKTVFTCFILGMRWFISYGFVTSTGKQRFSEGEDFKKQKNEQKDPYKISLVFIEACLLCLHHSLTCSLCCIFNVDYIPPSLCLLS